MAESFGPRTYLVGQVLPVLLHGMGKVVLTPRERLDCVQAAIEIVDLTLERMQWPNGRP